MKEVMEESDVDTLMSLEVSHRRILTRFYDLDCCGVILGQGHCNTFEKYHRLEKQLYKTIQNLDHQFPKVDHI